ncbi:UDP-N-acetylmuramoyl-L-alanyl-D-glutamate--2,6-diaminopimelate ligase [Thalassotalea sediminis]|uniref:UDP-N-acetylmuramoyl-L-alanyl-D-glutamate--2, 6-diaminopimelate ligase n=1 Tax=Thalassotalea sediminis TaxID=1759089 RepID=UPI002573C8D4|nr:UDP-N-acetylmuramoyl-L-alanyl-D-glutamate--2,6-diaminopimelate ligase [Thalassotalea sediminis]
MFNTDADYVESILQQFGIKVSLSLTLQARQLCNDSRQLQAGDIFCAVAGTQQQGEHYIADALAANSSLILVETSDVSKHGLTHQKVNQAGDCVEIISFYQLNKCLFALAKAFYKSPQAHMTMIGITGTNGKTSTSQIIAQLQESLAMPTGVIGTNGAGKVDALIPIANTTPGATELHSLLQAFVESDQNAVVMEVSSHALAQGRVTAELFDIAVFTNLSRDHLDYHGSMASYADAKAKIFANNNLQVAVVNGNDETAKQWLAEGKIQNALVYGRDLTVKQFDNYVHASAVKATKQGMSFVVKTQDDEQLIESPLLGIFNVDNLLAAISVLLVRGHSLSNIATAVKEIKPVMGRMETFQSAKLPLAVVDYAHTPDALANALQACREHCSGKLWAVFGCGGDRDKGKRAIMGQVAEQYSDNIIITNDNPRSEQPEAIANDVLSGCVKPENVTVMLERQQAVLHVLKTATNKDVVLFAGKGHEDYVEIQGKRHQYNEREWVRSQYTTGITQ